MKKALALLLSVLLIAALAACSNGDAMPEQPVEDTTTTTSATAEAPTADMSDTTGATDGGETADPQTETSADDVTALTKDTTASVTADTTAEKTTSATGKPHSTTTTEQPTAGKTDPTTSTIGKPTKNTTTNPTTSKPPVPAGTIVKPNNPEMTDPTTTTTKTTPSNGNGDHFDGDIIVVETPITHNDGLFSYAMSAKIPVQCRTTDDNISVLLSYGLLEGCDPADYITNVVLYVLDDEGNKTILRRIDKKEIMTDYRVDWPVDENGQLIGFVYSHTETISLPVSLCSKTTGRIWLVVAEGTSNGKFGVEVSGMSASICFDYVRSDTNIVFIGRDL